MLPNSHFPDWKFIPDTHFIPPLEGRTSCLDEWKNLLSFADTSQNSVKCLCNKQVCLCFTMAFSLLCLHKDGDNVSNGYPLGVAGASEQLLRLLKSETLITYFSNENGEAPRIGQNFQITISRVS